MSLSQSARCLVALTIFIATHFVYRVEYRPYTRLYNTGFESLQLGNSIALHGTFSDPFKPMPTGPSAHVAPAYPALVAVIIHFFGNGGCGNLVLGRITVLVIALQLSLLPFLARHLGMGFLSGVLAAVCWLSGPIRMYRWESDFMTLLAILLAFPMFTALHRQLSRFELAITGILWGVLLLFNPAPLTVLALWLVCLHFVARRTRGQILALSLLPLLIILPWIVRNYIVFSELVLVRDNLGLELAVSNNPCARYSIRGNPRTFLELARSRFVGFWFPAWTEDVVGSTGGRPRPGMIVTLLTLLSVGGVLLAWKSNRAAVLVLCDWLFVYPLLYYIVQYDERYRHPILWATFLFGCYAFVHGSRWILNKAGLLQLPAQATGYP